MNKLEIMNNITRSFNKVGFKLKKHSPEILLVAGVAGTVTSAVMACKATTKAADILDETHESLHGLHLVSAAAGIKELDVNTSEEDKQKIDILATKDSVKSYTEDDLKKDTSIVYVQTAIKFIKLYGPSIALGALSITSILASHNILRKRNIALAAAYATIDNGFKEYRNRVVERFGKDLDRELKYNIKAKEIEETVTNEDGTETTVKTNVETADINEYSDYSRFFDETCAGWTKDPEYNLMYLKNQQNYANEMLRSKGHLFLNEVYDMLGMQRSKAGQIVGWVYDEKNPIGDNYVDFGIYDIRSKEKRAFVNGLEKSILLDFNVDGNIYDLLG